MAFQGDSIYWVEVEKVVPNPYQPRREFDEQKLQELSESVRMYGILQPLTVTRKEIQREDGTFYTEYELVAGERRLRASKLAGLSQVPVIIREGENNDQEKLELAIIENLQREDLNSVDRAIAFKQLADTFGLSHAQVAKKVGRSREYVSNSIRLLGLPDYMLTALKKGEMTEGHGRTLLMLNDKIEEQDVVFREMLLKKLSVRELEKIVRKVATDKVRKRAPGEFDRELLEMEKQFMETLGTRVQIQKTEYGGQLTIDYFSVEDLEAMLRRMKDDYVNMQLGANDDLSKLTAHTPLTTIKEDETLSSKIDEETIDILKDEIENTSEENSSLDTPLISENENQKEVEPNFESSPVQKSEEGRNMVNEQNYNYNQNFQDERSVASNENNSFSTTSVQPVAKTEESAPQTPLRKYYSNYFSVPQISPVTRPQIAENKPDGYLSPKVTSIGEFEKPQAVPTVTPETRSQVDTPNIASGNDFAVEEKAKVEPTPTQTSPAINSDVDSLEKKESKPPTPPMPPTPSAPEKPVEKNEDDSDLYSIRHFTG